MLELAIGWREEGGAGGGLGKSGGTMNSNYCAKVAEEGARNG